ncbi:MAG: TonB-dependent receptor [Longimicrobiales bacterium]|nr:TonB-dependent receptor [Longimicrobiales bacterium]
MMLGVLSPASLAAQQGQPFVLDSLVVTATPTPRSVDAVANNVTILSGEELRSQGLSSVADALRYTSGLDVVSNGSFGSQTSLFLRGAESDHTLVLVDGMQVNRAGGSIDLSHLTTDNVERIEIVRGPASALYGSDALAGVVHVVTRTGQGPPRLQVSMETDSYSEPRDEVLDGLRLRADLVGGSERFGYSASLSRESTDGILAYNNRFLNTVFSGAARFAPDERTRISLATRITDHEYRFPTNSAGQVVDRNAFTYGDQTVIDLTASRDVSDLLQLEASLGVNEVDAGTDDAFDEPSDTESFVSLDHFRRSSARLQTNLDLGAVVASVGGEAEEERERSFSESVSAFGTSFGRSENDRDNLAGFVHLTGERGVVSFNAGARVEDNEQFGTQATWEGGFTAHLPDRPSTRLRASVGTGIKEPTFFENFATGFVTGNPELDPERSLSWEVGVEQELGGMSSSGPGGGARPGAFAGPIATIQATWFDQRLEDLIQYTPAPPNPGDPNYFNVAEATSRGLELEADLGLGAATGGALGDLEVGASYSWIDTEVTDSGFDTGPDAAFVEGERLLRRPTHTLALRASGSVASSLRLHTRVSYVGDRADRSFDPATFVSSRVILPSYTRWSLGGEWDVLSVFRGSNAAGSAASGPGRGETGFPRTSLTLRVDNLLDESYEEVWGFQAPGRQIHVGIIVGLGGGD